MKSVLLILSVAAVALAQMPTRPPLPNRPDDNPASTCGEDRMCQEGQDCLERRVSRANGTIAECMMQIPEGGECPRRDLFEGDDDDEMSERSVEDTTREMPFERVARERAQGGRDRATSRTISGAMERPSCVEGQRCTDQNMCMPRPNDTECEMVRRRMAQTQCDDDGNFEPLQCRRVSGEESVTRPSALSCSCVNRTTGDSVDGTRTLVMRRNQVPDCETRSFRSCSVRSVGRMMRVRHGEVVPRSMNNQCMRCQCEDGGLQCRTIEDQRAVCRRSDPQTTPRNCMMDGEMVMHNAQREDGRCNRCGCRDGTLQCTRIPRCRAEKGSESNETERDSKSRMCDECMNMTASPVCAVRDGRTFPTLCHAMRCQGFAREEVEDGACANRDHCRRDPCEMGGSCFALGGQTKMSRENSVAEDRRLCVNRTELRCRPTEMRDGMRRIIDDDDQDPLEELEDDDEDDDDTRTVCASDGNTYPSTCHMMVESSDDDIPRVNHQGPCQTTNRSVCGADGVTYPNVEIMRARGGNVRMDYMGECMRGDTPRMRCMMAMNAGRCQNLTGCTSRVTPTDGCCPICGSAVTMAMDQEALDERVRITGDLNTADDFMDRFFRDRGMDEEGRPMGPLINRTVTDQCNISISRPGTTLGNTTEVVLMAKEMRDGMDCHEHAMALMMTLNSNDEVLTAESGLVAAAIVAPQEEIPGGTEVPGGTDGAPTFTATTFLVLLCAYLSFLF